MANTEQTIVAEEIAPVVEVADQDLDTVAGGGEFGVGRRFPRA